MLRSLLFWVLVPILVNLTIHEVYGQTEPRIKITKIDASYNVVSGIVFIPDILKSDGDFAILLYTKSATGSPILLQVRSKKLFSRQIPKESKFDAEPNKNVLILRSTVSLAYRESERRFLNEINREVSHMRDYLYTYGQIGEVVKWSMQITSWPEKLTSFSTERPPFRGTLYVVVIRDFDNSKGDQIIRITDREYTDFNEVLNILAKADLYPIVYTYRENVTLLPQ